MRLASQEKPRRKKQRLAQLRRLRMDVCRLTYSQPSDRIRHFPLLFDAVDHERDFDLSNPRTVHHAHFIIVTG